MLSCSPARLARNGSLYQARRVGLPVTAAQGKSKNKPMSSTKQELKEIANLRSMIMNERAEVAREKQEMGGVGFLPGTKAPPLPSFAKPKDMKNPLKKKKARPSKVNNGPVKRTGPMRLSVVLSSAGVASRRAAEDIIRAQRVKVNGEVQILPQTKVDPARDNVQVDDQVLHTRNQPMYYFAVHKPKGYVCSNARQGDGKIVEDLFADWRMQWERKNERMEDLVPRLPPRLVAVGRLDSATTGLLLVTNDGTWAQRVAHPSNGITKEYIVTAGSPVTQRQLRDVQAGTTVEGKHVKPMSAELLLDENRSNASRCRVKVVVNEGRHHEVRELMKNAGVDLKQLKRTRIGGLRLAGLGMGQILELKGQALKRVLDKGLQGNIS